MKELLLSFGNECISISKMVVVGNPSMVHILVGVDPKPIGLAPYQPAFYKAATFRSAHLGFAMNDFPIQTLPQVSGFIGGDLLAAALAVDLESQPEGYPQPELPELLMGGRRAIQTTRLGNYVPVQQDKMQKTSEQDAVFRIKSLLENRGQYEIPRGELWIGSAFLSRG